jgi:putative phosphoribosyl transferase
MERSLSVSIDGIKMQADLRLPPHPRGVVVFAHGSGSSRHSPRNQYVANILYNAPFASLLVDLLTLEEEFVDTRTHELRFDVGMLADRLVVATDWLGVHPQTKGLPVGYFGASTGAAAALIAATRRPEQVKAIVSRGGRPDLAGSALEKVIAPTLLIVGEIDGQVIELNRQAMLRMPGEKELVVVPQAGHLFEEPGALERVARLAERWFEGHLAATEQRAATA